MSESNFFYVLYFLYFYKIIFYLFIFFMDNIKKIFILNKLLKFDALLPSLLTKKTIKNDCFYSFL